MKKYTISIVITFFLIVVSELVLYSYTKQNLVISEKELLQVGYKINDTIKESINTSISAVTMNEFMLREHKFNTNQFNKWAKIILPAYPFVENMQLAPNGIVGHIYPLADNEKAIGHDLFKDKNRDEAAKMAVKTNKITFIGPIRLIQNNKLAIIIRKPITIIVDNETKFWGFSTILIMLDSIMKDALNNFDHKKYNYALYGNNPDLTTPPLIASSEFNTKGEIYNLSIEVPNGKWMLQLQFKEDNSTKQYMYHILLLLFAFVSGFVSYIYFNMVEKTKSNLEKFIDTQDNIVILTDGKIATFANKKFFDFLGFQDLEEFKKHHQCICELFIENNKFFHLGKISETENWVDVMQTLPHSQRIVSILGIDFKPHAFSVSLSRFTNDLTIISFTDISQTMLQQIHLEEKVLRDNLTGAYNREFFEQNLSKLITEYNTKESKLALALLDIDHFKMVNDTYGHDVGDSTLIHFVKTVEKYSRKDDIFIRWGGEEFILILKVKTEADLEKALEHLRKIIEIQDFPTIGQKTCSIGGTIYKEDEDIEKTIKRADEAVYNAKESGRNKVVIS